MSLHAIAWLAVATTLTVLGVRVVLTETRWPAYRVQTGPRRSVRGLDALTTASGLTLLVALTAVILPVLIR